MGLDFGFVMGPDSFFRWIQDARLKQAPRVRSLHFTMGSCCPASIPSLLGTWLP